MSSTHPAFVSPAELEHAIMHATAELASRVLVVAEALEATTERLEARALRAERAILRLEGRVEELEALGAHLEHLGRDRVAEAERLHRALERRVIALEARP